MHIKKVRHNITKTPAVRRSLAWINHRGVNPSDVFVASYPRAGSTWLRFMLYELLTGNTTSFEAVNKAIPVIGRHLTAPRLAGESRLIQTHEPYRREYGRALYLVRDVRDIVISEYHFQQLWQLYPGTFQNFINDFLAGQVNRYGTWDNHTNRWLNARESAPDRILTIRFDELRQDTHTTLASILSFLGTTGSRSQIEQAIVNNTTTKMRKKESSIKFAAADQNFVRKGKVGGWQDSLTSEQIKQIELRAGPTLSRLGYLDEPEDTPNSGHKMSSSLR